MSRILSVFLLAQLNLKNRYLLKNLAPASEDYQVEQLHFHWGHANDDYFGSEHLHEGQSYPLEVRSHPYSSKHSILLVVLRIGSRRELFNIISKYSRCDDEYSWSCRRRCFL